MVLTVSAQRIPYLKALVHLVALCPLVNLYYAAINDRLGGDPVEAVIHFTGIGALNCLLTVSYTHLTLPTTPYV